MSERIHQRRNRILCVIVTGAGLAAIARALWGEPVGLLQRLGEMTMMLGLGAVLAAFAGGFRAWWRRRLRLDIEAVLNVAHRWHDRVAKGPGLATRAPAELTPFSAADRIALCVGLVLTVLDFVLTTLLLRDVFPQAPYAFDLFGWVPPEYTEWTFYMTVAGFKTMMELWFGVFDGGRAGDRRSRWLILGGASAFDAVLAGARGIMLAEQGITGGPVFASNVLFVGFGLVVPWIVAHTGVLLGRALDPLLRRYSLLVMLAWIPRLLLLGALWLAFAVVLGGPALGIAVLGIVAGMWFALENLAAVILGHGDPTDVAEQYEREGSRAPELDSPRTEAPPESAASQAHSLRALNSAVAR